jgi:hypothetical protein
MHITLTEAEREFIEIMREAPAELKLTIEFLDGAWEVAMSAVIGGRRHTSRGTGRTFSDAWGCTDPLWPPDGRLVS